MDRKSVIQEAAERLKARKALPQGKWVPLDSVLGSNSNRRQRGSFRFGGFSKESRRGGWAVLVDGIVEVGAEVFVSKSSGSTGARYVHNVVQTALERGDGKTVVMVERYPPKAEKATPTTAAPTTQGVFTSQGPRNPRICEECEGPCRPGAGKCDGCRDSTQL